jgi:hypothetical protein
MPDKISRTNWDHPAERYRETRRGEYCQEIALVNSSIPSSGIFVSTDDELMVAPRTSVMAIGTEGSTVPTAWTQSHLGSGSATQSQGELFLSPGATANSRARVSSQRIGRRRAGATQWYISVWRIDNPGTANNVRRFGMYNDDDGFFFEIRADGIYCAYRKNGVDTYVAPSAQNGPLLSSSIDTTKMNQFNLFYGGLSCRWQINGRVIHAIGAGVPTEALTASVNLATRAETINTNGQTVNAQLIGRGISFHRVSPNAVTQEYAHVTGAGTHTVVQGPGVLHRIIVNTPAAASTHTLYDNTAASGPIIAVITVPNQASLPFYLDYGLEFTTGLTIVQTGAGDFTVIYD